MLSNVLEHEWKRFSKRKKDIHHKTKLSSTVGGIERNWNMSIG